jgi:nitrite reductase/ring-hydroxylating ferredoxin subunit
MPQPSTHASAPHVGRRVLLGRLLRGAVWLPFVSAFAMLVERTGIGRPPRQVRVSPDFRDGFVFAGDVVVHEGDAGRVSALSTRCTHLGCRIGRVDEGLLVCSCHGSRFHADGRVATGPAATPLEALTVTADPDTGALVVDA